MPFETDNYVHMPNPEYTEEQFRHLKNSKINEVGKINFGAGISGKMGLLKQSGKEAVVIFLFEKPKWDVDSAKEWVNRYNASQYTGMYIEEFEEKKEMWITGITHLNKPFNDGRVIIGFDVNSEVDIPVRDLHSRGYNEIVGLTNSDHVEFLPDNLVRFSWKVTSQRIKDLVKAAKYPLKLFKYSVELGKVVRDGMNRSGELAGIAITDKSADNEAVTTSVNFDSITNWQINPEAVKFAKALIRDKKYTDGAWTYDANDEEKLLKEGISEFAKYHLAIDPKGAVDDPNSYGCILGKEGQFFKEAVESFLTYANGADVALEQTEVYRVAEGLLSEAKIEEDKDMGEKMEDALKIKDLEHTIETFEDEKTKLSDKVSDLESKVETFETENQTLVTERDDYKEKFETKEKDFNDLKGDHDALQTKVEGFETTLKTAEVEEVFELGLKVERFDPAKKDDIVKELFEISADRLEEKKENFEFMLTKMPKHNIDGREGENFEETDTTSRMKKFDDLFKK
jgi:hypothetical protein